MDKLHIPEIKKNFKECLEKLKNTARMGKKKIGVPQIEALEEKLRPFMDVIVNDQDDDIGRLASSQTQEFRSKKKNNINRVRRLEAMDEESSISRSQIPDEETESAPALRKKRSIIDESSQPKSKVKPGRKKGRVLKNKKGHRTKLEDEDDDEGEDDDDYEENTL